MLRTVGKVCEGVGMRQNNQTATGEGNAPRNIRPLAPIPYKATVTWQWPSGKHEELTGTILDQDESGLRLRWHDCLRGVTRWQTIAQHHIIKIELA